MVTVGTVVVTSCPLIVSGTPFETVVATVVGTVVGTVVSGTGLAFTVDSVTVGFVVGDDADDADDATVAVSTGMVAGGTVTGGARVTGTTRTVGAVVAACGWLGGAALAGGSVLIGTTGSSGAEAPRCGVGCDTAGLVDGAIATVVLVAVLAVVAAVTVVDGRSGPRGTSEIVAGGCVGGLVKAAEGVVVGVDWGAGPVAWGSSPEAVGETRVELGVRSNRATPDGTDFDGSVAAVVGA